jgi:hypothetical protein
MVMTVSERVMQIFKAREAKLVQDIELLKARLAELQALMTDVERVKDNG